MGICSDKVVDKTKSNTKLITTTSIFEDTTFFFSTQNLKTLTGDALVLFVDQTMSFQKNAILKKTGRQQTRLIQEYFEEAIGKRKLKNGQIFVFKNPSIPGLQYQRITVICLDLWERRLHTSGFLQRIFIQALNTLQKYGVKSICVAETDVQFGYPVNATAKAFVKAFHEKQHMFDQVTIVFNEADHRNIYTSALKAFQSDALTTLNENASIANSIYF